MLAEGNLGACDVIGADGMPLAPVNDAKCYGCFSY